LDNHGIEVQEPLLIVTNSELQIYAQGFGQGSAGLSGTGLQLVVIIFVELFGVSLGQLVAAITPSVQVGVLFDPFLMVILTTFCSYIFDLCGRLHAESHLLIRRCNYSISKFSSHLEGVGVPTQPVHANAKRHAIY